MTFDPSWIWIMMLTASEPHAVLRRRSRKYRLNTRPPAVPVVRYSKYSPVPKSSRSSQKNARNGSVVIADGNAPLFQLPVVGHDAPKIRKPFALTPIVLIDSPNPVNV